MQFKFEQIIKWKQRKLHCDTNDEKKKKRKEKERKEKSPSNEDKRCSGVISFQSENNEFNLLKIEKQIESVDSQPNVTK